MSDINNYEFGKYKRIKHIQMINEAPETVKLKAIFDRSSKVTLIAEKIIKEGDKPCQN